MFAEVNSLIFLLIFLVYFLICTAVYRRKSGLYDCREVRMVQVKWFLFCAVAAMLLTVLTIYLWFLVLLLMAAVIRYVWRSCLSKGKKTMVTVLLLLWMGLVGAAGLQLTWNMESGEEDDDAWEVQEPEDSIMLNGDVKGGRGNNDRKEKAGAGSGVYQSTGMEV